MNQQHQKGFSLVELLFVVIIIGIIALIYAGRSLRGDEAGGAEAVIGVVHSRIAERRGDAIKLSATKPIRYAENELQKQLFTPPLAINFAQAETTAPLQTNVNNDANYDGIDDLTGKPYTYWYMNMRMGIGSSGFYEQITEIDWNYGYLGEPLTLPRGWKLAQTPEELSVPLISNAAHGKGELVTQIAFDGSGKAYGFYANKWMDSSPNADSTQISDAPFWAIYFYLPNNPVAVAVAIHPSGFLENFRWDGAEWRGFANRTVN